MAYTYEEVIPTPIANAKVERMLKDGVQTTFRIQANSGYVLHDSRIDYPECDDLGMPTGAIIPWFKLGSTTVNKNYDFTDITNGTYTYTDENGMTVTVPVEKIGEYEFYTLPVDIVPTSQTMGGTTTDPEVM